MSRTIRKNPNFVKNLLKEDQIIGQTKSGEIVVRDGKQKDDLWKDRKHYKRQNVKFEIE